VSCGFKHAQDLYFLHLVFCGERFMVVASDGVWEFLSSEDVVEIVKGCAGDADRVESI
jgi:serine/threonine protein phosphatase PrpC